MKKRNGLTLIEITIAIGMVAFIAGILSPMLFQSGRSARISRATKELDAIASSLRSWYIEKTTLEGATLQKLNDEGYLSTLNEDPWGNEYILVNNFVDTLGNGRPVSGTIVFVYSKGPDGISQTSATNGVVSEGEDDVVHVILYLP